MNIIYSLSQGAHFLILFDFSYRLNPKRPGDLKEAYNVCEVQDETQVYDITSKLLVISTMLAWF